MMVPVNQNIDSYKDDFFKGLTMRQTLFAVTAVAVSGGLLTFFLLYLKMNASLAMFVKIHGIGLSDYLKRKKKVQDQPSFFFQPEMIFWSNQGLFSSDEETDEQVNKEEEQRKSLKKIYLETEETEYIESNEGIQGADAATVPASEDGTADDTD